MLKLLTAAQSREAERYTIENEPIESSELMERASHAFVKIFIDRFPDRKKNVLIFCGRGNNGGDGLAISRLLFDEGYQQIQTYIADFSENSSEDFELNLERLQEKDVSIFYLKQAADLDFYNADFVIDALFGSGLNRPLQGEYRELVKKMNQLSAYKVSVDVPSGMPCEGEFADAVIVKSDFVVTFQRPKLNFLLPISGPYIKDWKVANIGLDENYIQSTPSPYYWLWKGGVQRFIKARQPFEHKGLLGHALIVAGAKETMGAALICTEACVKAGAGLTSAMIPSSGLTALNTRLPEAMYFNRGDLSDADFEKYSVVAIGPGLGTHEEALGLLKQILNGFKKPMVIDADAINLLSKHPELLQMVPEHSVFTPHMKEFDRLFGTHNSWWQRIETARRQAKELKAFIVLKNRYTMIFSPGGICYFNSSGSPAMASGGMGDALTGIIASLISQGYEVEKAIQLAVFSHGYAGEQLAQSMLVVPATALIKNMPQVLKELLPK